LAALADRQHGVVAREQLLGLGVAERTVERWLAVGRLRPLNHGAYAVGHIQLRREGRWLAAVFACGEGAVLSHRSAAALWGLTWAKGPVDVTSPRGNQGRARMPGIRLHRCRLHEEGELTERHRIPVTSVARTLFDFAEAVDFERLRSAWEEMERLKLLRLREVERVCERGHGRRALRPIRLLLAEAIAAETVRSPLEQRFLTFCRERGIPTPATNVHVLGHEVDCLWPAATLIVELDSWEFHAHRRAFERDRARDPKFLLAGYRTIRVTHRRLDREADQLAEEIRGLLRLGDR
jgi:predicted transcriptional regulator of viral defense system